MMNWLKKLWNWLKNLFNILFDTNKTVETPSQPSLSDAEYENILFALLAAIKRGRSWGSCQGFLISRNVKQDDLAEWIEEKSLEWLDNRDKYQELGRDLEELGNIASGKLGNIATTTSRGLIPLNPSPTPSSNLTLPSNPTPSETQNTTPSQTTTDELQRLTDKNENLELFELGLQYLQAENYEASLDLFEKIVEIDPNNIDAWIQKGITLEKLGRYTEAIEANNKVISGYPNAQKNQSEKNIDDIVKFEVDNYINWFEQGNVLFNLGKFEEAIASFDKALEIKPDYYEAWDYRGIILCDYLGKYEEAIVSFDKALEIKPDYYKAWHNRGVALRNLGRLDEAIASWDQSLELKPDDVEAWYKRAVALRNLGRLDEEITSHNKILEIEPDDSDAWYNLGTALWQLGRFNEAIASYDKALEFKPDDVEAWHRRGIALGKLGKFDEGITSYDKALEMKPDLYQAWYSRGIALYNLIRLEEAITSYDKALEIKPDDHETWSNRGSALGDLGRLDEAIASFNKALEIKPDIYQSWYNRGSALDQLGRFDEGITSYDKALEIKPDLHQVWHGRGRAASRSTASERKILRGQSQFIERFQLELTDASTQLINYFQSLETGDFRDLISVLQQPPSEKLIQFLYQSQLMSISRLNPELNKRGYEGQLISYRYPLNKHIYQDSHPEGWGFLHHKIGVAQYEHKEYHNAINSYYCALETLTVEQFPELRLKVIQDLVKAYLAVGDKDNADDYLLQGLKLLNELVDKVPIEDENQRLRLEAKFLIFRQLTVNVLLEKGEIIEALRNAELEKNRRLTHILEGYNTENQLETDSNLYPSYEQIQTLLNEFTIKNLESRNKAIVYWFNSPMGLITFIIKQNSLTFRRGLIPLNPNPSLNNTLEEWIKQWDKDYKNYRDKKDTEIEYKTNHPWRNNLSDRLETLKEILEIPEIEKDLQDIEELILIPHQDLHRFPLHYLFNEKDWTVSYLPSLQIGLKLQQKSNNNDPECLLSIENPRKDLVFSQIESAIINTYFATIDTSITTIEDFKNALPNHNHLHFTGHGYYNFDDPKRSFLEFENKSQLTAYEISHLNFNSYELITLAACETALNGKQTIESEYVGLVSAFLKGGANCVISTLWTVDETSSAWLMIYFYQQYRAGIPQKIALKNAQNWLKNVTHETLINWLISLQETRKPLKRSISDRLQTEIDLIRETPDKIGLGTYHPYNHPYYWLGFTVNGNL